MATLDLNRWRAMTIDEKATAARSMVSMLPSGSSFVGLTQFDAGGNGNTIAVFGLNGAKFNLIPGGEFQIGFDVDEWEPTDEERESWEGTAAAYGLDSSSASHLRQVLNPRRTVFIPTMLVESSALEFGWKSINLDDARVRDLLKDHKGRGTMTAYQGSQVVRVRRGDDGNTVAHEQVGGNHSAIVTTLAKDGFRLPTSDEWELLCGAGMPTLFRWGDHVPCDRYPRPTKSDWNFHLVPNSFGLLIAQDPYRSELVVEPNILRGGDGGGAICGGTGFFSGWLPLATSYFEKEVCFFEEEIVFDAESMHVRRVLELD